MFKFLLKSVLCAVVVFAFAAGCSSVNADQFADAYVVVDPDGHLTVNGERVRFWSAIGKVHALAKDAPGATTEEKVANARKATDVILAHLKYRGFNSIRYWGGLNEPVKYTVGDGSHADSVDYFIFRAKQEGMKIWLAGLNSPGTVMPEDVNIIDEPTTAENWKAAVKAMAKKSWRWEGVRTPIHRNLARIWDPRLEKLGLSRMQNVADHYNEYTKMRWGDDPVFGAWELSNEEWWIRKMMGGQWQKLPAFFRNSLIARWHQFLRGKYGSNVGLAAAWDNLLPGESLEKGTVLLAPVGGKNDPSLSINDASAHAKAALEGLEQEYAVEDFPRQRGADVIEFFMNLLLAHKQREHNAVKTWGKSCRGTPLVWDTGIGYRIQCQYMHQVAGVTSHDAYVGGTGKPLEEMLAKTKPQEKEGVHRMRAVLDAERPAATNGRWVNWLLKPPGICKGVPWLEHNRVEKQPYFCYETQIQQPAKYRADFPLRIAALATIQDWDWVAWHYFGDGSMNKAGVEDKPFEQAMDITTGSHPQGYHYTYDEVQNSLMRAAGYIWRQQLLKTASNPTKFIYGRKSLYDPDSIPYGGSYGETGMDMLQTVYEHGMRIEIDPTREDDEVIGPVVKYDDRNTHNPYSPTDEINFDHKKGSLSFDSPAAMAWTGLLARCGNKVHFRHGVSLTDVRIHNPDGIYSPVTDDEKYIAFAVYSQDGKSLAECEKASVSLMSTSFNSGFKLGGGAEKTVKGELPVLVARVAGKVKCDALDGMKYVFRDWHNNAIGEGTVAGGVLVIPNDKPVFCVELTR